jgi:hypothetical protein
MGRHTFAFLLGFVAGATSVVTYQALRNRKEEVDPENLLRKLGSKLQTLESRIAGMAESPTLGEIDGG